jgi:hypothetical protein
MDEEDTYKKREV